MSGAPQPTSPSLAGGYPLFVPTQPPAGGAHSCWTSLAPVGHGGGCTSHDLFCQSSPDHRPAPLLTPLWHTHPLAPPLTCRWGSF
jgi:hypothetical protein